MKRRVLVTGGAGFIGSHLVKALLARGDEVRVLDSLITGNVDRLVSILDDIDLIEGDIRDPDTARRACDHVHVVFHQAALPSVQRSIRDPWTTHEINASGTLNLLIAARDASVNRFIMASSSSVYGDTPTLPKIESMRLEPRSPYAVSKMAAERYCMAWKESYNMPVIALRYFNVFGPYQDPYSMYSAVIPRFITCMLKNESPIIFGDGHQSRDFTYIDNVILANILASDAPDTISGVFNVAGGEQITLIDVISSINTLIGKSITPIHQPARSGDIRHSHADITQLCHILGFHRSLSFIDGLTRTVTWYQTHDASSPGNVKR
jgi:UDP-glucose 4-epimerase